MSDLETSHAGPTTSTCASCGGQPRWESLLDGDEERWLSVCRCGRMQAFLADSSSPELEDPLAAFLTGLGRTLLDATPPWVRVFLRSVEEPNAVRWRYCPGPCPCCETAARFALRACPRPNVLGFCTLCLDCGYVTAAYWQHSRGRELPATGGTWTPPCPAVQRLRDCIFRPYAVLTEGEDGNLDQWVPTQWVR